MGLLFILHLSNRLELNRGHIAVFLFNLEERLRLEVEKGSHDIGWHPHNRFVIHHHAVIVELAVVGNFVLDLPQLLLQVQEFVLAFRSG